MFKKIIMMICILCFCYPVEAAITVIPDSDIPSWQVDQVEEAAQRMEDFMWRNHNLQLNGDVKIYVASVTGKGRIRGTATMGAAMLSFKEDATPYYITFLTAHELTHQYQMEMIDTYAMDKAMWFVEGMADFIGAEVAHPLDESKWQYFISSAKQKNQIANYTLNDIAPKTNWKAYFQQGSSVYAKADMALIYLNSHYPLSYQWSMLRLLATNSVDDAMTSVYGINSYQLDSWM